MKTCLRALAAVCALLLLGGCSHHPGAAAPALAPPAVAAPDGREAGGEAFQSGFASWYGDEFHGKATADGEVYDMHKLTAAHPQLPFHTLVEVENLGNGRRVLVRINDRGPFLKGRIIDLSLAAAQRLGMAEQGTAEVRLRVLRMGARVPRSGPVGSQPPRDGPIGERASEDENPPPGEAENPTCVVQVGAFSLRENAEDLLLTLADIFPGIAFRVAEEDGLFKVVSPELNSRDECRLMLETLSAYNLQGFLRGAAPAAVE